MSIIKTLQNYTIPDGILHLAPTRLLFRNLNDGSLAAAIEHKQNHAEKRGPLSSAIQEILNLDTPDYSDGHTTIESHIDAKDIPDELANKLVALGFEPDGFHKFMPETFTDHYTLKFKAPKKQHVRIKELTTLTKQTSQRAYNLILSEFPTVEFYIEMEVYPDTNRLALEDASQEPKAEWRENFPLPHDALKQYIPPQTKAEADKKSLPLAIVKHSDIHIKVNKNGTSTAASQELISRLCAAGFYNVITWSGNSVCTAQFQYAADSQKVFNVLKEYFKKYGGMIEMTLEAAPFFWRGHSVIDGKPHFSAIPPIITSVDIER